MKFLIIDSQYLIYKSLFAHKHLTATWQGKQVISGLPFGYIKALVDMKATLAPDFIVTVWEGGNLHKKRLYPPYKQGRKRLLIDIGIETALLKHILKSLRIPMLFAPGYEGEDVANFLRKKLITKNNFAHFYTNDADCFALIRRNFVLVNNKDGMLHIMDRKALQQQHGITPRQAAQIKILAGCSTDNVAGFAGIGEKYATYLVKKYGTAEATVLNCDEHTKPYLKLNAAVAKGAPLLPLMTTATAILTPPKIKQNYKRGEKRPPSWHQALKYLECKSLLKGMNLKILKIIEKDQKNNIFRNQ